MRPLNPISTRRCAQRRKSCYLFVTIKKKHRQLRLVRRFHNFERVNLHKFIASNVRGETAFLVAMELGFNVCFGDEYVCKS